MKTLIAIALIAITALSLIFSTAYAEKGKDCQCSPCACKACKC